MPLSGTGYLLSSEGFDQCTLQSLPASVDSPRRTVFGAGPPATVVPEDFSVDYRKGDCNPPEYRDKYPCSSESFWASEYEDDDFSGKSDFVDSDRCHLDAKQLAIFELEHVRQEPGEHLSNLAKRVLRLANVAFAEDWGYCGSPACERKMTKYFINAMINDEVREFLIREDPCHVEDARDMAVRFLMDVESPVPNYETHEVACGEYKVYEENMVFEADASRYPCHEENCDQFSMPSGNDRSFV